MRSSPLQHGRAMRSTSLQRCVALAISSLAAASLVSCTRSPAEVAAEHGAIVSRYCTDCHSLAEQEAGLVLEKPDLLHAATKRAKWEKVIHKLNAGLMPPPGEPRPSNEAVASLVSYLETSLDATAPEPAGAPVRRLNRAAYGNAVRDLLGFPIDVETQLPAEIASDGFDNVADTLKTSSLLLERYLTVGLRIAAMAVGDTKLSPQATEYRPRLDLSQNDWIEGLPYGTRGGLVAEHYFPTDAEYEIRPDLWNATGSTIRGVEGFETPFELQILIDGVVVHSAEIGGADDDALSNRDIGSATTQVRERLPVRVPVTAGLHRVGVTFAMKSFALQQRIRAPLEADLPIGNDGYGWPIITRVLVAGPYESSGPGDTATRRALFTCRPSASLSDTACAERILGRLALRAYGRPLNDRDLETLRELYASGSDNGRDFEAGIQLGLARILSGPEFLLYHGLTEDAAASEHVAASEDDNQDDGVTLASRLALFLWNSIPDDQLLDEAIAGRLRSPEVLAAEVRRMLADPRAETLVSDFAEQWLQLRLINSKSPDERIFPSFDDNLRRNMLRETRLFLRSVFLEDSSVLDLLRADYTFLNERLSKHYGIDGVFGDAFRRVELTDPNRRGLLGQGSILFLTSVANRTSPVFRGKWIMTVLFDSPPPPPPPNVPALEDNTASSTPHTVRERMEQHRKDPVCAACHSIIDPPGLALENFDPIGRWRETDSGQPVDATTTLPGGIAISGPGGLREAILSRPELFVTTLTEKLMVYALGRRLEAEDMPTVRRIVREAASDDYRFSAIVLGIVRSAEFRRKAHLPTSAAQTVADTRASATSTGGSN
jgi:mono/diheme cytochrome c family protein